MAIQIRDTYSGRTDTSDPNYPFGKGRNVVGGVEGTGTPFEADWYNNLEGFLQGLLLEADITPDGQVDNANSSQLVEAVRGVAEKGNLNSIKDLGSINNPKDGQRVSVNGFYADTVVGGGDFVYDAAKDKADHNGGTIIAPEAIAAWDGTQSDIASLLNWSGTGVGCFVRLGIKYLTLSQFGGSEVSTENHHSLSAAVIAATGYKDLEIDGNYTVGGKSTSTKSGLLRIYGGKLRCKDNYTATDTNNPILEVFMDGLAGSEFHIHDVELDGNRGNNVYTTWLNQIHGFRVDGCDSVSIYNNKIISMPSIAAYVTNSNNVIINSNVIEDNFYHGIFVKGSNKITTEANSIIGTGDAGVSADAGGIGILYTNCNKVVTKSNTLNNTSDTASKTEACDDVIYESNIIDGFGKDGIKIQSSTEFPLKTPFRAVVSNNIVKNAYAWRSDGSSLIQISDTKLVTVSGNVIHSDTGTERYGIRCFNHNSGDNGQTGFVTINNNVIGKTFLDTSASTESIGFFGGAGGGHTFLINNNMTYGSINGGDAYGQLTINGNIVGSRDILGTPVLSGAGINASGSKNVISGNTVSGFEIGVVYYCFAPSNEVLDVNVIGNTITNTSVRSIDIGSSTFSVLTNMRLSISGNVIDIDNSSQCMRIRVDNNEIESLNISSNSISGLYRSLVEILDGATPKKIISAHVGGNSEYSTMATYFESPLISRCKRLTGDYAFTANLSPPIDGLYRRGDFVRNIAIEAGRPMGWVCTDATLQTFVATANL